MGRPVPEEARRFGAPGRTQHGIGASPHGFDSGQPWLILPGLGEPDAGMACSRQAEATACPPNDGNGYLSAARMKGKPKFSKFPLDDPQSDNSYICTINSKPQEDVLFQHY